MFSHPTEEQQGHPTPLSIHGRVIHLLAHRFDGAQVMVLLEQPLKRATLLRLGYQHYLNVLTGLAAGEQDVCGQKRNKSWTNKPTGWERNS